MSEHDEMHDDDKPIGRLLSRREALALFGSASAAALSALAMMRSATSQINTVTHSSDVTLSGIVTSSASGTPIPTPSAVPDCVVVPALTEGPYFVDEMLERQDIRADSSGEIVKQGVLLKLMFRVSDVTGGKCGPLPGAQVDVWHCDAEGRYSGVVDRIVGFDTSEQDWLRGYQITDENGLVEFVTICPGWYPGRAGHIHFKIRTDPRAERGHEFTSQVFFPEEVTDIVHTLPPYDAKGYRNVLNEQDGIFRGSDGLLTLKVAEIGEKEEEGTGEPGYAALFDIGLDLNAE
jgi:protocatechuate 3,4-dioxygenase beta subunit